MLTQGCFGCGLGQGFPKQSDAVGIGYPLVKIKAQKLHANKGQSITDLIFLLVMGEVIQRLHDEQIEHVGDIKRRTAYVFSAERGGEFLPKSAGTRFLWEDLSKWL